MSFDLNRYINERCELIDGRLKMAMPDENELPFSLHKSMRYSTFAGGKRLRPILLLAACDAVGGDLSAALPAACAMEMVHTYSLIHDDLPAMDNDDFRRGNPTNHKVFGDAVAILAGDALLTQAFILLSSPFYSSNVPSDRILDVIHEIAYAAGSRGMVGGQVVDMESEGCHDIDLPTVQYIHTHKTGALIKASVKSGAILGGGDERQIAALNRYGEAIGLAFQIADDILDVVGTTDQLGKDAGSDQARGKATYPSVLGLNESRRTAAEFIEIALESISELDEKADPLREIAKYILNRKS
ncbi:MAG: polyprenyl synthetase family protein [Geobacteraceae bacterium]|nr:polyprenyl synthetase family protein [Geobacteraceae bacterium]